MHAQPDVRSTALEYDRALSALYVRAPRGAGERGGTALTAAEDLEARAQAVVERSEALREAATRARASPDADRRELAELQLLASAAIDLQVAGDLVRLADDGEGAPAERAAGAPAAIAGLRDILQADPDGGVQGLLGPMREREVPPSSVEEARQELADAVNGALIDIRDAAANTAQVAIAALTAVSAPDLQRAASAALSEVLRRLGEGVSRLAMKAVALVVAAVQKLLAVLGADAQDAAREKAAAWVEELQRGNLTSLLDRLYESDRIRGDVAAQLAGAPAQLAPGRFHAASRELGDLSARFAKQASSIRWVLQGLSWVRPWLVALQPWGAIALPAAYVATLAVVVYLGGDYADWFRTGGSERLDLVEGIRTVVRRQLAAV